MSDRSFASSRLLGSRQPVVLEARFENSLLLPNASALSFGPGLLPGHASHASLRPMKIVACANCFCCYSIHDGFSSLTCLTTCLRIRRERYNRLMVRHRGNAYGVGTPMACSDSTQMATGIICNYKCIITPFFLRNSPSSISLGSHLAALQALLTE